MDPGRRRHYADFYDPGPADQDGPPVALVHGNCQAESLRIVLAGSATFPYRTVRVPPVHELTAEDLPHLDALLAHAGVLLGQPVRDGYRDLPLGTRQLAAKLPAGAQVLRWPVIRYAGLHPWSAIVRHPSDRSAVPPVVPYHDLRTVALAAGRPAAKEPADGAALREAVALSVSQLAHRERRDSDVGVSDLLVDLGAAATHTLNHPGNPVLVALARRLQHAAGHPADAPDPGRTLLGGIRSPLTAAVLDALDLNVAERPGWTVDGRALTEETVRDAHLRWYRAHPAWVEAGLERHADALRILGL
ncbi:MAG: WcbI family polysaccharide biosynthesis putative acetyltransferase [Pseudonocardia sp.]|nr:WcbI family polysaccharide biosynthesis putative acetyltransferase [Pseudonocardia sp.]